MRSLSTLKIVGFLCLLIVFGTMSVQAQNWNPKESLEKLEGNAFFKKLLDQGIKPIPLGDDYGYDGWLMTNGDQVQVFYAHPDSSAVISGFLVGPNGENVTAEQLARYEALSGNSLADRLPSKGNQTSPSLQEGERSPSQIFWLEAENAAWFSYGDPEGAYAYIFIDPSIEANRAFIRTVMRDYVSDEKIALRLVPLVDSDEEADLNRAYRVFTSVDPVGTFLNWLLGETIPRTQETSLTPGQVAEIKGLLKRNRDILKERSLDQKMLILFKDQDGTIKIIQGAPKDIPAFIEKITAE